MKIFKSILSVIVIVVLALGLFAGCNNASTDTSKSESRGSIAEIKERGKIRIGVFGDKYPFGYVDENGENQGFDVYIARRFAKDLLGDESKVEFVIVDAASRVAFLESNKVDIIMANFTVTEER